MAYEAPLEVVASAARTSSGNSGVLGLHDRPGQKLNLIVDITAVGGDADETMDIAIEWSTDGTTFAVADTADTFGQMTQPEGVQTVSNQFDVKAPHYRIVWTLVGTTPSFTFSIDQYVT